VTMNFAEAYAQLSPNEQTQFADAVRRLMADGLIWREDENDRRIYNWLLRQRDLVADYLRVAGWELHHDEAAAIFHVVHREGAHRRRLNRDTTIWLLILRLLSAELREKMVVMPTRYPIVSREQVVERYNSFFPGQLIRKKSSLDDAFRTLATLKLIRKRRGTSGEESIELLPALEVMVPANNIAQIAETLQSYQRTDSSEDESESETE
jgi:hypothetical protein